MRSADEIACMRMRMQKIPTRPPPDLDSVVNFDVKTSQLSRSDVDRMNPLALNAWQARNDRVEEYLTTLLPQMKSLRHLTMSGVGLTTLELLDPMTGLHTLKLEDVRDHREKNACRYVCSPLSRLSELRTLELFGFTAAEESWAALTKLRCLTHLNLSQSGGVVDMDLSVVSALTGLRTLKLNGNLLRTPGRGKKAAKPLDHLRPLTALTHLSVAFVYELWERPERVVKPLDVTPLNAMTSLERLDVGYCNDCVPIGIDDLPALLRVRRH